MYIDQLSLLEQEWAEKTFLWPNIPYKLSRNLLWGSAQVIL